MSNQVFPAKVRGLDFSVVVTDEHSTIKQSGPSFVSTNIIQTYNPIHHFSLVYNYLRDDPSNIAAGLTDTDLRTLRGFYNARHGSGDNFLFSDPDDHSVTDQELSVVTDGVYFYSPLQRNMGGFMEDITDLDSSIPLVVHANGALKNLTTHYTVEGPGLAISGYAYMGLYLKWVNGSPVTAPADPVTATFGFYHRVEFEEDKLSFERFWKKCWTLGGANSRGSSELRLVSSRRSAQ